MKLPGTASKVQQVPLVVTALPPISAKRDKGARRGRTDWGLMLLWAMRILACLWMFLGLRVWCGILGIPPVAQIDLEALPVAEAALVLFFAIFDLVAAVGLWLAAPWGGVLWLVAVLAQFAQVAVSKNSPGENLLDGAFYLAVLVIYFSISWLAAKERDENGG